MEEIRIGKYTSTGIIPTRKHNTDAGLDLYADEGCLIPPHGISVVGTGIAIDLPSGFTALVMPKSRNNYLLGAGVVDAGYQGEIRVKIVNVLDQPLEITTGQAIAQLLIVPIETPIVRAVPFESLFAARSDRGETGGIHQ